MEINETTEELLAASRRARRVHWDMHLFNHQRIGWPEWEMRTKAAAVRVLIACRAYKYRSCFYVHPIVAGLGGHNLRGCTNGV